MRDLVAMSGGVDSSVAAARAVETLLPVDPASLRMTHLGGAGCSLPYGKSSSIRTLAEAARRVGALAMPPAYDHVRMDEDFP